MMLPVVLISVKKPVILIQTGMLEKVAQTHFLKIPMYLIAKNSMWNRM